MNGYYKAELIRGPARTMPWKTVEDVELATLGWVPWHNTTRLHGFRGGARRYTSEGVFAVSAPCGPHTHPQCAVTPE